MKLFNTLTGEHFDVIRMANRYMYTLKTIGENVTRNMNHEQFAAYLRKVEIVEEEV
ncbi:hypothetical protein ACP3TB_21580 (plasmid) [Rahnella variigena]|uniref:hypothetical protein n=1 Tax=Rahnella variigena TaxID=574964 RepID=UPI003CF1911D